ncbi:arginyl-tRNA synthetase [Theileria orientalis strain Shintoku]|uniref:arginine--tRNA ligase n=1 Tax=Theileria orientalis strain Shintoku TaxID=869250 RepID=J4C2Y8_THEOR|nr:arginyl-tRNA synthetase [Theileria orientalis strain Shintoku]BAM39516.1 arginyl-tRNA synthetase [Theileria orientalis strain Shintoku]|eukprot:XP_009689817.1 arginyl-tRNA synthetase [Theileria orientalis strain Shintoku]
MKCVICCVFTCIIIPCLAYKTHLNGTLQFTSVENIVWVTDSDPEFDLHTKVGRTISDVLDLKIDQVNDRLCNEIKKDLSIVDSCQISHDELKVKLRDSYLLDKLDEMEKDERLSVGKLTNEKVVVDYFSPNVGKMLHMGHIRSLVIGQSLSNLLEFSGSKVCRRNHVGDFGLQCGILMRYLMEYDVRMMEALEVESLPRDRAIKEERKYFGFKIPEMEEDYRERTLHLPLPTFSDNLILSTVDSYYKLACNKFTEDEEFCRRARHEAMLLQNSKSQGQKQWEKLRNTCVGHYEDMAYFYYMDGLKTIPESYYKNVADELISKLVRENKAREEGKEVLVNIPGLYRESEEQEDLDDLDGEESEAAESEDSDSVNKAVLRTAEGSLTYMATDLAALSHRVSWNKPDRVIYVTESNQRPHFKKLYKIAKKLDMLNGCKVEHVGFGQVRLEGAGKLRSRSGSKCSLVDITKQVVKLVGDEIVKRGDYLELKRPLLSRKIGVGSMIFSDLSVERHSGYNFSLERLMNQGNNGLIAILYAYVRCLSLLKKTEQLEPLEKREFRNASERNLGRSLLGFENTVLSAVATREPHRVCRYLRALCKAFSRFYEDTQVIEDGKAYSLSVRLVKLTSRVIEEALKILNIQPVQHL